MPIDRNRPAGGPHMREPHKRRPRARGARVRSPHVCAGGSRVWCPRVWCPRVSARVARALGAVSTRGPREERTSARAPARAPLCRARACTGKPEGSRAARASRPRAACVVKQVHLAREQDAPNRKQWVLDFRENIFAKFRPKIRKRRPKLRKFTPAQR